jgi:hypothetical protein
LETSWKIALIWLEMLKGQIGNAFLTVIEILWVIAIRDNTGKDELIKETLMFFPPDGREEPKIMCELILQMRMFEAVKAEVVEAIARLLCLPRMTHKMMGVNQQIVEQMVRLMKDLIEGMDWAEMVRSQAVGESEDHRIRLQQYL